MLQKQGFFSTLFLYRTQVISKLEWLDQFIFTPCLETDEKCRPFTNATASQKTGRK